MSQQVQDKYISLNGLRFHYREWGMESARPLVLLHGWLDHARVWDTVAAALADDFRVLALDQRGHGESQWASEWLEYSLDRKVADLAAFVTSLGLARLSLLGHASGGAYPEYIYAAQHPELVTRLVIVDAGPGPQDPADAIPSPEPVEGTWFVQDFDDPEVVFANIRALWTRRYNSDEELRHWFQNNIVRCADGRWTWRFDSALHSPSGLNTPPRDDAEQHYAMLSKIACPTLLVRGEESHSMSRAKAKRMVDTIPDCRLVEVARSTHWVHIDNPSGFVAVVRPFLLEVSSK